MDGRDELVGDDGPAWGTSSPVPLLGSDCVRAMLLYSTSMVMGS